MKRKRTAREIMEGIIQKGLTAEQKKRLKKIKKRKADDPQPIPNCNFEEEVWFPERFEG